jgi:hypothetical protein
MVITATWTGAPARIPNLDGLPDPLTALEVACLVHDGFHLSAPGTDSGLPMEGIYQLLTGKLPTSPFHLTHAETLRT